MTKDMPSSVVRRVFRVLALVPAIALVTVAVPAFAEPPEAWPDPDNGSDLDALLLLVGAPLLLILVITVLVYLPSMIRGQKYEPALAWRDQPEWFGGPRKGVEAAPSEPVEGKDRGGASANW